MLLGFLIFVVLLSGLVAYSADTIARRAGRRHLRLFGLRPKTTALIVAVASGMGISLASVLAYGLLNRAAINNIQQADRLRIELSQLKKDVAATTADLTAAEQERDAANRRVLLSRRETAQAQADLQSAEDKLKTTQAARSQLAGEVSSLQAKVARLGKLQRDLQAQADASSQALAKSQQALSASRQREQEQSVRLSLLSTQIVELDSRSAQSAEDARSAQTRAGALQAQIQTLEASRAKVQTQLRAAQTGRDQAVNERAAAQAQSQQASAARDAAIKAREEALQARDLAQAQQASLAAERDSLASQRKALLAQRDAAAQDLSRVRGELGTLQTMVGTLESQRRSLAAANDALRSSLSSAQANLSKLEVDYTRTNSELSASRNTDLIYSRNDLVYAGVVASVRNVPDFLKAVSAAAQKQGAGGTPAAQLSVSSRAALETKLRGLNTNTFVQCRAAVNVTLGFPVDLNCDARPQLVLFRRGQVIKQASINLQSGTDALSAQLTNLIRDTVFELTSRGVPPEYINDLGLSDTDRLDILGKLGAQSGASATVALAARDDVRLGNRIDLYPVMK